MRRLNPNLGLIEFWFRLLDRGYSRHVVSLYRVLKRLEITTKPQKKPYQQMAYPGQRIQVDVKFVPKSCCPNLLAGECFYQYTAIDEFSRLRFLMGFKEHSTYSSATFLEAACAFYAKHGINIQCVQTDNGFEFTNRFSNSNLPTLFQKTAMRLNIHHKLIKPFTPRHNGKVERSHREDQKRFYNDHSFYSFDDFINQLNHHLYRSNKIPMRPLKYNSPLTYLALHRVQLV